MVSEYQDVGSQSDSPGASGQVAERRQRIPVAGAPALLFAGRQGDVLAAGEVVVAESICGFRDLGQVLDRGILLPAAADLRQHRDHGRGYRQLCHRADLTERPDGCDGPDRE